MARLTIRDRVLQFQAQTKGKLTFVSGKWFYDKHEIRNINQYIARAVSDISSPNDLKNWLDMFVTLFGSTGYWPELTIINEAKTLLASGAPLQTLPFPLTREQLMIIRIMLDAQEEVMFIVTGVGGSGKSTYLNIISQIYDNDVASCALSELTGYNTAEAVKHRLIASNELASDDLDNKTLKTIISRQTLQVNPKYIAPYDVQCQSALFFCCNRPPRIDIDDTGMLRRIIYYKMNKKIENPDLTLNRKLYTHDELLTIVAHAYALDTTDWKDMFMEDTKHYLLDNNSVYIFRDRMTYDSYRKDCLAGGLRPYSLPRWLDICTLMNEWGVTNE